MSIPFAGMVTPSSVSFTGANGKNYVVGESHMNSRIIREKVKELLAVLSTDDDAATAIWQEITDLADVAKTVEASADGLVQVRDGEVYYRGAVIHNSVTRRIIWCIQEGYPVTSHVKFLENLMENPSKYAVDQLFNFLEASNMGLTEDGHIIAYKRVRGDYTDCHSGKFDNSVGQIVEMMRNGVDDNQHNTCSTGLHFCSQGYLPHFGNSRDNRIVIVKINPRDVVSVPTDYSFQKARCCRYEVIGEYEGDDKDDILSSKPVWSNRDVNQNFRSDYEDYSAEGGEDAFDSTCYECDNHVDDCVCERCDECDERLHDCECVKCDICDEIEDACICPKPEDEVDEPYTGPYRWT